MYGPSLDVSLTKGYGRKGWFKMGLYNIMDYLIWLIRFPHRIIRILFFFFYKRVSIKNKLEKLPNLVSKNMAQFQFSNYPNLKAFNLIYQKLQIPIANFVVGG